MYDLKGKNIIVTGANSGIGLAIIKELASYGTNIWACMRTEKDDIKEIFRLLEEEYKVRIKIINIDLSDEESVKAAAKLILGEKISIDGLVNNAASIGENIGFLFNSMDNIRNTFEVNVFGPLLLMKMLLKRLMKMEKSSIVNISSIASFDGEPGRIDYVASKAAINGITKKLANVYGQYGIRVNAVAPGMVNTKGIDTISEDLKKSVLSRNALNRLGEAEEIANIVAFLLSDKSAYITGQIIRVDGGGI